MRDTLKQVIVECELTPIASQKSDFIEVSRKQNVDEEFVFVLNHSNKDGFVVLGKDSEDMVSGAKLSSGVKIVVPAGSWMVLQSNKH